MTSTGKLPPLAHKVRLSDDRVGPNNNRMAVLRVGEGEQARHIVYHKNPFDWGGHSMVYAGIDCGRAVVVKRLATLAPQRADGDRATLARYEPGRDDRHPLGRVLAEVEISARVEAAAGRPFAAAWTERHHAVSKVYAVSAPMRADLLGVVHLLGAPQVSDPARLAVAQVVLLAVAEELAQLHGWGWVHGDVRAENILVRAQAAGGDAEVRLRDFSRTHRLQDVAAGAAEDVDALARVGVMLLRPERRPFVQGADLARSVALVEVVPLFAPVMAVLRGMLAPPVQRLAAAQVAAALRAGGAAAPSTRQAAAGLLAQVEHKGLEIDHAVRELGEALPRALGLKTRSVLSPDGWAEVEQALKDLAARPPGGRRGSR